MNRKRQNLIEIWDRYHSSTCASEALDEIRSESSGSGGFDLENLLRYHGDDEVEDEDEVAMRDAFDDLLAYYSCVEVGAIIGFVPSPLPGEFRATAAGVLCNPYVRKYYRKNYPLLLPDMLLIRISGLEAINEKERAASEAIPLFFEFLHISMMTDDNPSIEMFLWFLDDGYHKGCDWNSTLAILTKPQKLVKALSSSPRNWNPAEQAVDGLRQFLGFCVALDDLLARSEPFPLFRAAMWHYHGYWFRILRGEVRKKLENALRVFDSWLRSPTAKQLSKDVAEILRHEAEISLKQVRKVVKRLTGTAYGKALSVQERKIRSESARAAVLIAG
jgi:hypothetical protein